MIQETWIQLGMVGHTYNPSNRRLRQKGSKSQASLGYIARTLSPKRETWILVLAAPPLISYLSLWTILSIKRTWFHHQ
jgi:hypothetical protein